MLGLETIADLCFALCQLSGDLTFPCLIPHLEHANRSLFRMSQVVRGWQFTPPRISITYHHKRLLLTHMTCPTCFAKRFCFIPFKVTNVCTLWAQRNGVYPRLSKDVGTCRRRWGLTKECKDEEELARVCFTFLQQSAKARKNRICAKQQCC